MRSAYNVGMMWHTNLRDHPQAGIWYQRVQAQPSWVVKAAVTVAIMVVVVPLLLLTLAAVAVGLLTFLVLGAAAAVVGALRGVLSPGSGHDMKVSGDGGRINVRVIRER